MINLKISTKGLNLIKEFEGCRLAAYRCPAGVLTIGYGHTGDVREGQKITNAQATELLCKDLAKFEKHVMKYDNVYHFTQNQFDALVSFAFNVGSIDQLTAKGTRSIKEISAKIPAYNKAGGKVLAGLTRRRKAEKAMFDAGANDAGVNNAAANKYKVTASALNVRTGSGTNYSKCGLLYRGECVEVTKVKNGWGYIGNGWVSMKYITAV